MLNLTSKRAYIYTSQDKLVGLDSKFDVIPTALTDHSYRINNIKTFLYFLQRFT